MSTDTVLRRIYRFVRLLTSGLFLYASCNKLFALPSFAQVVNDYGLVPEELAFPVAVVLVAAEIITALALLVELRGGLCGITLLLLLFIAVLLYGIHLGLAVDCGCFGPENSEHTAYQGLHQALYRDLAMLVGVYWYRYRFSVALRGLRIIRFVIPFPSRAAREKN